MIRATQTKGAPVWGLLGCALLMVGVACTKDNKPSGAAQVPLADHGVGLLTQSNNGESCYELRAGAAKDSRGDLVQYSCMKPTDKLSTGFLVNNNQLAVGGAVASSVTTVTVNGQPAYVKAGYFLAVLPTVPGGDLDVTAADQNGHTLAQQQYPHNLIVSAQQVPASPKP